MATRKILREFGAIEQAVLGTFDDPTIRLRGVSGGMAQDFDLVVDEAVDGQAFMDLPLQGQRHVTGTFTGPVDVATIEVLLKAGYGAVAAGVFTAPSDKNEEFISIGILDDVKYNKYGDVFLNSFTLASEAEQALTFSFECIGKLAEVRAATGGFPSSLPQPSITVLFPNNKKDFFI